METLREKIAVITGAAGGIGRASTCAPADRGAHIVPVSIDADVSDRGTTVRGFGRVDAVADNVGVLTNLLPEDIPITEWQRSIDIVEGLRRRAGDWDAYLYHQSSASPPKRKADNCD